MTWLSNNTDGPPEVAEEGVLCYLPWWTTPGRVEHYCELSPHGATDHWCACGEVLLYDGQEATDA